MRKEILRRAREAATHRGGTDLRGVVQRRAAGRVFDVGVGVVHDEHLGNVGAVGALLPRGHVQRSVAVIGRGQRTAR